MSSRHLSRYGKIFGLCGWLIGLLMPAWALINPKFSPIQLTEQATVIAELQFLSSKDQPITAVVKRVLKGELSEKTILFDLTTSTFKEQIPKIASLCSNSPNAAVVFCAVQADDAPAGDGKTYDKAFLHINGEEWVTFYREKNTSSWNMEAINIDLRETWNGGSDMLLKCMEYILQAKDAADVPCDEEVNWTRGVRKCGTVSGVVRSALPVILTDDGRLALYVASESGDAIFEYEAASRNLKNTTTVRKLAVKSRLCALGDLNGDGKLDLVSYDGDAVTAVLQDAQGVFTPWVKLGKAELKEECVSLAVIDCGKPGHPGVVISTKTSTLLWIPDENGTQHVVSLNGADVPDKRLGSAGRCLVADLDGDSIPDILQLFTNGSLIFKGKAPGQFEPPKPCQVALGKGPSDAFLGDFDADGLLDIFTTGTATELWNNRGKFEFVPAMRFTGELSYNGIDAIGGMTCDVNTDGRQDVTLFYAESAPLIFFNRGFRSFGVAKRLTFNQEDLPEANKGIQAGCWGDFDGDGIQALVLILKNGEVSMVSLDNGAGYGRCLRAGLSGKGRFQGPLTVTGYSKDRCLGAWNVLAGTSEAFLGIPEAGPLTLRWKLPDGKPREKTFLIENKPQQFFIP